MGRRGDGKAECGGDHTGWGEASRGKKMDTEDDTGDHLGANHHTKEFEKGKTERTFGIGRNMLGAVRRGRYTGAGLGAIDLERATSSSRGGGVGGRSAIGSLQGEEAEGVSGVIS